MKNFRLLSLGLCIVVCAAASIVSAAPPAIQPGSWTLAVLPDTQFYARLHPDIFSAQTRFLAENKAALNLAYVLHEGDIVDYQTAAEWQVASDAIQLLDAAGIPYSLAAGNHDFNIRNRTGLMATYFPVSRLAKQPTFGGVFDDEPNSPHNSYSLFRAGGTDWLVLSLEFGPRDQVVEWADGLLKKYSSRQAMIVTHAYLYPDGTRYDWAAKGEAQSYNPHALPELVALPGGVNDGQEMWDKLRDNPNLQFIFSGHVDTAAYLASATDHGNVVHQILADYQGMAQGGSGYLRLLEFMADGKTVRVRTYSPWLDAYRTDAKNDFTITMTQVHVPEPKAVAMLFGASAAWGIRRLRLRPNKTSSSGRIRHIFRTG